MAEAFRDVHEPRMDAKGRVSVPADFVKVLKSGDPTISADKPRPGMILVYGGNKPCLQGYTISAMARITRGIERMSNSDPRKAALQRSYGSQSVQLEVGDDGRIVLPIRARQRLGLADTRDGEVVFAGKIEKFEIWSRGDFLVDDAAQDAATAALIPPGADVSSLLPDLDPGD